MYYAESSRRNRWRGKYVCGVILAVLLVAAALVWWQFTPGQTPVIRFTDKTTGLRLAYDQQLLAGSLSAQDRQDHLILRLTQKTSQDPPLQVTIRYEKDLHPLEAITKQHLRDALLANVDKTYPTRFPDYKELQRRSFSLDSHDAGELVFSYTGPRHEQVKQHFLIFVLDDDRAVYISAQSKAADFERLDRSYFEPLLTSLRT